ESYLCFDENPFFKVLPEALQTALKSAEARFMKRKNLLGKKLFGEEADNHNTSHHTIAGLKSSGTFSSPTTGEEKKKDGDNNNSSPSLSSGFSEDGSS